MPARNATIRSGQGTSQLDTDSRSSITDEFWRNRDGDAQREEPPLSRSRQVRLIEIDRSQLRSAAQLRSFHGVRTSDSLQIAAALSARCPVLVTNDRNLPAIPGLRVLQLRDYV